MNESAGFQVLTTNEIEKVEVKNEEKEKERANSDDLDSNK